MALVSATPTLIDAVDFSRQSATEINPFLFVKGGYIYEVLLGNGATTVNIFKSAANGTTSAVLDSANAPVVSNSSFVCYSAPASSVITIAYKFGFFVAIVDFDTATDTYGMPSVSAINQAFTNGTGVFYRESNSTYYVFRANSLSLDYITMTAGVWSAPVAMTAAQTGAGQALFYTAYDPASGIATLFYLIGGNLTAITLSAADVVGTPVTIGARPQWVDAVIRAGVLYFVWVDDTGQIVYYSTGTVAASPTFAAPATLESVGGSVALSYPAIAFDGSGVLTAFWVNIDNSSPPGVDEIDYSQLVAAVWTAPDVFYDAVANPPPDDVGYPGQFIHTQQVIWLGGWFVMVAMEDTFSHCVGYAALAPDSSPVPATVVSPPAQANAQMPTPVSGGAAEVTAVPARTTAAFGVISAGSHECAVPLFIIHKFRFRQRVVGEYIDGTINEYYESPEFSVAPGRVGELKDFLVDYDISAAGGRLELYSDLPNHALALVRTLAIPYYTAGRQVYAFPLENPADVTTEELPAGQLFKVRLYPPPGGILRLHGRAVFRARVIGVYFEGQNGEVFETQDLDLAGGMGIFRNLEITAQTSGAITVETYTELPNQDMRLIDSQTINPRSTTTRRLPVILRLPGNCKGELQRFRVTGSGSTRILGMKALGRRLEVNGGAWQWYPIPFEATLDAWMPIQMPVRSTPEAFDWVDVPVDVIE